MTIEMDIFVTVLLALIIVEVFKVAMDQVLMDRRHNQMMEVIEATGELAVKVEEADEDNKTGKTK